MSRKVANAQSKGWHPTGSVISRLPLFAPLRLCVTHLAVAVALAVWTGCTSSPWSSHEAAKPPPAAPAPAPQAATADSTRPDPHALQQVMAELQQMGEIDPAAREKILADLKQTDPALWPLMMQQTRALLAYRRQDQQRDKDNGGVSHSMAAADAPRSVAGAAPTSPAIVVLPASAQNTAVVEAHTADTAVARSAAATVHTADTAVARKPAAGTADTAVAQKPAPHDASAPPSGPVVQASYNAPVPVDWHDHLLAAIHQLEAQSKGAGKSDTAVAQQAYLRMLYLLAGRRDDALSPIPDAAPAAQDYWSKQLYGLAVWLDTDHTPDGVRRAAETKRILDEALARLGESAPLVVRNLAFCTEVQGFGSTTPFRKAEFAPNQEVLLYAELDNYTVESTQRGFHTALRSSYQVFDARGQRIADHDFAATEEYCQSPRHDFFIAYHLRLPKRIYTGKHTLQLTVEDLKSHKVGQSSIEFSIKGAEE
jgi:hypothetical protein